MLTDERATHREQLLHGFWRYYAAPHLEQDSVPRCNGVVAIDSANQWLPHRLNSVQLATPGAEGGAIDVAAPAKRTVGELVRDLGGER